MRIIGFGHRRAVGKDTACTLLYSHLRTTGYAGNVAIGSFAYALKHLCSELFDLNDPEFHDKDRSARDIIPEHCTMSVRDIWIKVGNDMRAIDPDIWVKGLMKIYGGVDLLLVSDMRYPNEVDYIRNHDGLTIKIDRPSEPKFDDIADSALADYTDWDHTITNDGDLKQFNNKVIDLLSDWCKNDR